MRVRTPGESGRSTIKSVNRGNAETGAVLAGNGAVAERTGDAACDEAGPGLTGEGSMLGELVGRCWSGRWRPS